MVSLVSETKGGAKNNQIVENSEGSLTQWGGSHWFSLRARPQLEGVVDLSVWLGSRVPIN